MLGQPQSMLMPEVIGFKLTGKLNEGVTATDLVLTVTQMLRKKGVVNKFVEFFGPGLNELTLADRATIANMAPEYGATCGFFPVDDETLNYLTSPAARRARRAGRSLLQGAGLLSRSELGRSRLHRHARTRPWRGRTLAGRTEASRGPRPLTDVEPASPPRSTPNTRSRRAGQARRRRGQRFDIGHGDVVIAAITSCTNTSNPSVLIAAGLLARNAVAKGLTSKPWVKTLARAGIAGRRRLSREIRTAELRSTRSASTSSASAAPPASAIRARCSRRSRRPSTTTASSPRPSSRATATSKAASAPTCRRTIWRLRRSSSPMRSPARCKWT